MRRIRIQNPTIDKTYKTFVSSDYSSGTALTVYNNSSFAANDILVVGEPREELTESKRCSSVATSVTINLSSALNFSHPKGTPVYRVLWDFVSIESRSSSSGSFAEITQSGIQWDNKNGETVYYDASGTDSYQYRFRFYNSVTATYSEYSPTLAGSGFTRSSVGFMIREVRTITGDIQRKVVTDDELIRFFNRAQDIIYSRNTRYWFLLVDTYKGSNGISATASTSVYSLASYTTLGNLDTIRYRYNSGGVNQLYHLRKKSNIEFDQLSSNLNETNDDWAEIYKLLPADSSSSKGYLQIFPTTKTTGVGTIYPNYYEKMSDLDSVDDETQVPIPALLEDYAIGQVERIKGNEEKGNQYEKLFYGPPDTGKDSDRVWGLTLLDELDDAQKNVQGQPKSLSNFRGTDPISRFYGRASLDRDTIKEFYDM